MGIFRALFADQMVCSRVVAGLFVLAACAVALPENPGLSTLDNVPSPNVRMSIAELDKVDAVPSVKEMERMIMKETDAPSKAVEDADDDAGPQSYAADVQQEEVAIGNTLRTMEAKEAVKEELKAEVPVDCQLGSGAPGPSAPDGAEEARRVVCVLFSSTHSTVAPSVAHSPRESAAILLLVLYRRNRTMSRAASLLEGSMRRKVSPTMI